MLFDFSFESVITSVWFPYLMSTNKILVSVHFYFYICINHYIVFADNSFLKVLQVFQQGARWIDLSEPGKLPLPEKGTLWAI